MRIHDLAAIALALAAVSAPPAAAGQTEATAASPLDERAADIAAVLRGERDPAQVFTAQFIAAVPPDQLRAIGTQMIASHGPLLGASITGRESEFAATLVLDFERARVSGPVQLSATPPHQVAGLLIRNVEPKGDSREKIMADLGALPGSFTAFYAPLDPAATPLLAHRAEQPMALGSTFKLYVLSALAHEIAAGRRQWDEVVRLDQRSFPSGAMRDWPRGAPVTLHSLATAMISVSDNTATDQLIAVLGRDVVEREVRSTHAKPAQMLPLLTTLEFFVLKADPALARRFAQSNEQEQARLIAELSARLRGDADNAPPLTLDRPTAIDSVEWFATPADLQRLLGRLAALSDPTARAIMAVNPAVLAGRKADFPYIGYKGGSEPGVLNLTWLLEAPGGEWRILTLGWSNPAEEVDAAQLTAMAQRILALGAPAP
ncbi:serine hydrolase [Qipengyuania sp. YIM B01966]|uniref:serine hydrolase n=1 Tax=Qipengyuania sp. YIM B01966 TaxID=2778646 RepID=UPI0018F31ED4|nr:serine hydrolase [Qipengyuania sp. YIM B01966]